MGPYKSLILHIAADDCPGPDFLRGVDQSAEIMCAVEATLLGKALQKPEASPHLTWSGITSNLKKACIITIASNKCCLLCVPDWLVKEYRHRVDCSPGEQQLSLSRSIGIKFAAQIDASSLQKHQFLIILKRRRLVPKTVSGSMQWAIRTPQARLQLHGGWLAGVYGPAWHSHSAAL
jgi:hypothetical protein